MNSGAAKACRADRRLFGSSVSVKVPRSMKREWKAMSSKERGKLRQQWNVSQFLRGAEGDVRHQRHLDALKAFVKPGDLKL